jgi:ABC-type polysaccharide/polyol phosphate export permease
VKTFRRFSERFYLTILGLTIPFCLLLYGASGHQFRLEAEARNGMIIILTAFATGILYLTTRKFKGKEMTFLKYLFGLTLLVTLFGAIGILWSMISFKWGDDIELLVQVLFYLIPVVFILSIINIGYGLFKDQTD